MNQPPTFHGAFVFRKQDHGILSSTYFNTWDFTPYPETAKLKSKTEPADDPFTGVYETIWLEKNAHYVCDVEIILHKPGVYKILWNAAGKKGVEKYEGYGMLETELLVGFYYYN